VGGDRPVHKDTCAWWQGERAEIHLLVSNGGDPLGQAQLAWRLTDAREAALAGDLLDIGSVPGGEVMELATITVQMPPSKDAKPIELTLSAALVEVAPGPSQAEEVSSGRPSTAPEVQNAWRLWAVPRPRLPAVLALEAPLIHAHNFAKIDAEAQFIDAARDGGATPLLVETVTESLLGRVRQGARALVWQRMPDARYTLAVPFWREAIHVFEPHPFWDHVPHAGHADMRFFSVATDHAIDPESLSALLGSGARTQNIWRRFDARRLTWADYVLDVALGRGRMFVSTLSFEGGLGGQPDTFDTNPMGSWMLSTLLRLLANA
jgi:hypothetical protein